MAATSKNPHVLTATDYPNLLEILRNNNVMLDGIQKGLNDYLEKKRLFFPRYNKSCFNLANNENFVIAQFFNRFFFLSNDELLEILSETKDPTRVQPHLKKCFEGIDKLNFNDDMEVEGMVSAQGESIKLSGKIIPADAKVKIC